MWRITKKLLRHNRWLCINSSAPSCSSLYLLDGSLAPDHLQGHSTLQQGPSSAPVGAAYSRNSPISPPLAELTFIKPHLQRATEFCRKRNLWSWLVTLIHPNDTQMFLGAAGVMQECLYNSELWNFNRHLLWGVQVRRDIPWWDAKQNDLLNGWINTPPVLGGECRSGDRKACLSVMTRWHIGWLQQTLQTLSAFYS